MPRRLGLAVKLILFFVASSTLIFVTSFGYNYVASRKVLEHEAEEKARYLLAATVNRIEANLRPIQKVPEGIARWLEQGDRERRRLTGLLGDSVSGNPEIFGAAVAFEPWAFSRAAKGFAPYYFQRLGLLLFADLAVSTPDYFTADWYQIARELGKPEWSEPYFDEGGGGILMATYSVPFYQVVDGRRTVQGVATADVSLEWLAQLVGSIRVLDSGYAFLVSRTGTLVTHPQRELIMNASLFGLAELQRDPDLRAVGRRMIRGESGLASLRPAVLGKESWLAYAPVPSTGWSLALVLPKRELYAQARHLSQIIALLAVSGLAVLSLAVAWMARSLTRPLRTMVAATQQLAAGDLDTAVPIAASADEVGQLSAAFESMRVALKAHIRRLTETTAVKERIESELQIAHDIQMNILPKTFPPFPDRKEFEIDAVIQPAREVGGDFYDFFFTAPDRFCFLIADVSGKGVPASLFMAVTRTLLKTVAREEGTPDRILRRVNDEVSSDNPSNMFVSVFCGILETDTGRVTYANAGHNPPLLLRREGPPVFLEGARGVVLGAMEGTGFQCAQLTLDPGDLLLLYTDGVTEAENARGEFYQAERLQETIAGGRGRGPREVLRDVLEGVKEFAGDAPQSDDITLLLIRYTGSDRPAHP
jgi:phosphoserine phosphatase RsbU/P